MATALIQLDNGIDRRCCGWSSLPGSAVTQVVVTASVQSPNAPQYAKLLHDQLLVTLRQHQGTQEVTKCGGSYGPGADGCWAAQHKGSVRRSLIWVVDPNDANGVQPIVNLAPLSARPWTTIIPIVPWGFPIGNLPAIAGALNIVRYTPGQIASVVPAVMAAAGLGLDAFRIFISYRRDDCSDFAEQLFDGLSHDQFDVYLDRFRTPPGINFAERIRAELVDKACVVRKRKPTHAFSRRL